jgi:hypothetical protein
VKAHRATDQRSHVLPFAPANRRGDLVPLHADRLA